MNGVGIAGAFLGGVASLLSPCSALLLPSFFAYAFDRTQRLVQRTLFFWGGLCAVLVPLGAGVGAMGSALTRYREQVTVIGGVILIAFGIMTLLGKGFGLSAASRLSARIRISSTLSVLALGAVYGLAGFCAGPLLGAVLTMSAMGADPVYGALLMALYALGMAAPLLVLAWTWERFALGRRSWLRGRVISLGPVRTHTTSLISGLVLVGIGGLFVLTDGTASLGGMLSVDSQYDLQVWLSRLTSAADDVGVLAAVAVVALVWLGVRLRRHRRDAHGPAGTQDVAEDASRAREGT
ncbi:cytochrome c biogenesis protein [Mycolicibacterium chubuense NBB4]|uniref:Cytochrome c biogenesis protein n=1 Tax=Mycolicibacterium chubuense (strain NBB4) TaxID=710421 RepID=I4BHA2_MYCCN|nr:cytochrome c biogenesis CcdA family protein [Mycolicibacterium chubuense]AFM16659.1 cytochrome c biogenesis protein [Mycolicibacterium chubuense NBB4]